MTNLQVFKNSDFGTIRTVEQDGEPWFVGKDVAKALGYKNTRKAIQDHVDDEDKRGNVSLPLRGAKYIITINESGLYSLILSSKLPNAKKFKRWVTSEVLPAIRKHGAYMVPGALEALIADPDVAARFLDTLKAAMTQWAEAETKTKAADVAVPLQPILNSNPPHHHTPITQKEGITMAREFSAYRDCLADILDFTGGARNLSVADVKNYTGIKDTRTVKKHYPAFRGGYISAPALARFMAGGEAAK